MEDKLRKFRGSILGLAIGDALGYPCEFRTREKIIAAFPPAGVTDLVSLDDPRWPHYPIIVGSTQPPGIYSDDTQMTVALAKGLLDTGPDAPLDELMQAIGRRFVDWSKSPDNNRAPGGTCMTGCQRLASGVPWRESGVANSKGCGSAMRVAPLGLVYADDIDRLLEVARASSILTHGHDAGIEGAASAALLVALALQGASPQQMYDEVMRHCAHRSDDFRECMQKLPAMLEQEPAIALSNDGLGEGWVAEEAVASALYCVMRHPDDYAAAVLCGANTDGDSDSIATIAGSIMGARLGIDAIPERWQQNVEDSAMLSHLAGALFDAVHRGTAPRRV